MNHTSSTRASKVHTPHKITTSPVAGNAGTIAPPVQSPSFDGTWHLLYMGFKWLQDGKHKPHYSDKRPRPNVPGPQRDARAARVRRELGIPDHATSGATTTPSTLSQLRGWVGGLVAAQEAPTTAPATGCVFILDCPEHRRPKAPGIAPAFSVDRYVKALGHLYAPEQIHRVPVDGCDWVYTQNLVKSGPNGVMFLAQPYRTGAAGVHQAKAIEALRRYFDAIGQPYQVLPFPINWANVDHERLPDGTGLLVMTNVVDMFELSGEANAALIEAYGKPDHVLMPVSHAAADLATPSTGTGKDERCYDDDLSRKFLWSATGKLWAMFRAKCYGGVAYMHMPTETVRAFDSMGAVLQHLGIGQIPINNDDDAARLPANSVSRGDTVVLPQPVSDALMKRFEHARINAVVPEPGQELGNMDHRQMSLFAIHCVVAQRDDLVPTGPATGVDADAQDGEETKRSEL